MEWIETKGIYKNLINRNNIVFLCKKDNDRIIFRMIASDYNVDERYNSEQDRDADYERIVEELRRE